MGELLICFSGVVAGGWEGEFSRPFFPFLTTKTHEDAKGKRVSERRQGEDKRREKEKRKQKEKREKERLLIWGGGRENVDDGLEVTLSRSKQCLALLDLSDRRLAADGGAG